MFFCAHVIKPWTSCTGLVGAWNSASTSKTTSRLVSWIIFFFDSQCNLWLCILLPSYRMDCLQKKSYRQLIFYDLRKLPQSRASSPASTWIFCSFHFLPFPCCIYQNERDRKTSPHPGRGRHDYQSSRALGFYWSTKTVKLVFFDITECLSGHCGAVKLKLSFFA